MNREPLAAAFAAALVLWSGLAWAGRVHPDLEAQLRALPPQSTLPVIVEMTDLADPEAAAATAPGRARAARTRAVKDALEAVAIRSQGPVRAILAREQARGHVQRVVPFWIFNGFAVTATEPVIRALAARPDVWEVRLDRVMPPPAPVPAVAEPAAAISEWNIDRIRAPEVWALNPNYAGIGTVVGSFDTGVDLTHPDLASQYRGDHAISWFDPYGQHATPFDSDGHGTHTIGTAVGGDAAGTNIGVAPGATWIAAKAWNDAGVGTTSAFHQIFQWFLAPGGDASNAPDVVNSSWGFVSGGCITEFQADIQAWRAAGIFPAFAAGNNGPGTGSVRSPGAYPESFAVGATDVGDVMASFSGRGPSPCGGIYKPDVSAPGVAVRSSVPGGYAAYSGTSMATPHVSGAVAVLRSMDPSLTVDQLESVLADGAVDLGTVGSDNTYGAGRLDLFQSAQIVLGGLPPPPLPTVTITATDPTATEVGATTGAFAVSRTGETSAALTVTYTVGGTATSGSDYTALSASVVIPSGSSSATVVVTPIDDTRVEPDETVTVTLSPGTGYAVGSPASATVTITSDDTTADLIVSTLTAPSTAGAGSTITASDTTWNQGTGAADASTTRFYLSTNTILDASDVPLGGRAAPALGPGSSSFAATALTIPAGTATGTYYLIARADGDFVVAETSETNNARKVSVRIGPNLTVSSLTAPTAATAGSTITVSDRTRNAGGGGAGPSRTRFYLSTNATFDAGDVPLGSRAVPALAAGGSSFGSTPVTILAGTATGTYYLIARADADATVVETSETNNDRAVVIQISSVP